MQMSETLSRSAVRTLSRDIKPARVCGCASDGCFGISLGWSETIRRVPVRAEPCQAKGRANWAWTQRGALSSKQRWGCGRLASTLAPLGGLLWGRAACHLSVASWVHQSGRDLRLEPSAQRQIKSDTESTAPHWGARKGHHGLTESAKKKRGEKIKGKIHTIEEKRLKCHERRRILELRVKKAGRVW